MTDLLNLELPPQCALTIRAIRDTHIQQLKHFVTGLSADLFLCPTTEQKLRHPSGDVREKRCLLMPLLDESPTKAGDWQQLGGIPRKCETSLKRGI